MLCNNACFNHDCVSLDVARFLGQNVCGDDATLSIAADVAARIIESGVSHPLEVALLTHILLPNIPEAIILDMLDICAGLGENPFRKRWSYDSEFRCRPLSH